MDTSKRRTILVEILMTCAFFSGFFGLGLLCFYENTTATYMANILNIVVSVAAIWLGAQRNQLWDALNRHP